MKLVAVTNLHRIFAILNRAYVVSFVFQSRAQRHTHILVIVDYQNLYFRQRLGTPNSVVVTVVEVARKLENVCHPSQIDLARWYLHGFQ